MLTPHDELVLVDTWKGLPTWHQDPLTARRLADLGYFDTTEIRSANGHVERIPTGINLRGIQKARQL